MSKKTVFENFIYNTITTIFTLIIGLVLSVIIARSLGPADYGIYSNIIWILGVISIISLLGFPFTIQKYVSEYDGRQDQDTLKKIIGFVLRIQVFWGIIIAILVVILADKLSLWLKHPKTLFWIMALIVVPSVYISIFASITKGLQIFKNIMVVTIIAQSSSLALIYFLLKKGGGVAGILWVHLIIDLLIVFIYGALLREVLSPAPPRLNLPSFVRKRFLGFNFTLLIITVTEQIIRQKSGVFFLNLFRPAEEAGYYSVAFSMAIMAVRFMPESLVNVIGPAMSNRYGAQDRTGLNQIFTKSTKYATLLTVPICAVMLVLARPLVELVYGKSFLPAAALLPALIIASGLGLLASVAFWLIYSIEKQNINLAIGLLAMAINLTLAVLLVPGHGVYGAVITNLAAQGIGFVLGFAYVQARIKLKFPLRSFLKTCFAGIVSGGLMHFFMNRWGEGLWSLAGLLILGIGIYLFLVFLLQRTEIKELKDSLRDLFGKQKLEGNGHGAFS